ncbi:MAG: LCP family protein [Atopobiaceae bacterium]
MLRRNRHNDAQKNTSPADSKAAPHYTAHALSRENTAGRYTKKRQEQARHRGIKIALISVLAVCLTGIIAAGAYVFDLGARLGLTDQDLLAQLATTSYDEPFYLLLMGVDTGEERAQEQDTGRSDSMMLVRIDPVNVKVTMVSLHRDALVDIDGYGEGKLNSAYAYGGGSLVIKTVNQLAGVNISHYAEVDFDSFTQIVDSIGGITVNLPTDVYDPNYTGLDLAAGEQTLDGNTALLLCRCRHAYDEYGDGDTYRAANQRMVIAAIIKKVLASDATTKVSSISAMADSITTDMSLTDILSLANQMKNINMDEDVYTAMTPTEGYYYHGVWYEKINEQEWQSIMQRVNEGLPPYEDDSQDETAGVAGSVSDAKSSASDGGDDGSDGSSSESADTGSGSDSSSSTSSSSSKPTNSGKVIVLNGAGAPGLGTSVAKRLAQEGYDTESRNAASFGYAETKIYYNGQGNKERAEAIAKTLGQGISVVANDGSVTTSGDVVVLLGEAQANLATN